MGNTILSKDNEIFNEYAKSKFLSSLFDIKPQQLDASKLSEAIAKACEYVEVDFLTSVLDIKHRVNQLGYSLGVAEWFALHYTGLQYKFTPLVFAMHRLKVDNKEDALEIIYRNNMKVSEDKESVLSLDLILYLTLKENKYD